MSNATGTNAVVTAGYAVLRVFLSGSLTAGCTLSVGYAGQPNAIVPASAGMTSDILNAGQTCCFTLSGLQSTSMSDAPLVLFSSAPATGYVQLYFDTMSKADNY